MLNTKQRAQLRALANPLAVTLIIGKEGVTGWGCDLTYDYVRINAEYAS